MYLRLLTQCRLPDGRCFGPDTMLNTEAANPFFALDEESAGYLLDGGDAERVILPDAPALHQSHEQVRLPEPPMVDGREPDRKAKGVWRALGG